MAILPSSGAANGKPIFDWNDAAAQLTRSGNTWTAPVGAPAMISYAFRASAPSSMPDGVSGFQPFNTAQIMAAEASLALWSDVANITFVRVGAGASGPGAYSNSATMLFANYTNETGSASGFAYLPSPGATGFSSVAGDIWIDVSEGDNAVPVFGDFGPHVLAHEIGHAIGLNHPGNYDGGSPTYAANASYWQDARMFTIMSYFGSTNTGGNLPAFSWGPQLHDIAAAQRLYGANMTTRTGDTTYGFNSNAGRTLFEIASASQGAVFSIWDAGGIDTLDLSGYSQNADIDLREESFSSAGPTPDNGPARYNISIARGVVIENAVGGSGADTMTGNAAANSLVGNAGNDLLSAGAGADTMVGGDGNDIVVGGEGADSLDGGSGVDTLDYSSAAAKVIVRLWNQTASGDIASGDVIAGFERVLGGAGGDAIVGSDNVANLLVGGGGADGIQGLSGYDTIRGGAGADTLNGGSGVDTLDYSDATGKVVVRLWNQTATGDIATGDVITGFERVIGGSAGDAIVGSDGVANYLVGNGGADNIQGLSGDDYLVGGAGNDTLTGGADADRFEFAAGFGNDRITDFQGGVGAGDVIRLIGLGAAYNTFAEILAATTQVGANAVISLGGNSITLVGFNKTALAADDFLFA